ncbi:calcium-binding protein [Methylopila sp. Yamaguchi]|uniref:calcium-binding protein n=1 Tax=Methylopila sp. Yamaguchi TaxID=1437817 RepID=UPI000CC608C7|nr:calcium-binding protein [Methylopila sp. Yamaguchi]GBD50629.1 hemolysin-type calcium-binding protein [Methylopila sp. Yamaguchi]
MAQPVNDNIENAIVIAGDGFTYSGTTADATLQVGEPAAYDGDPYPDNDADDSVWFVYTASATGTIVLETEGFDSSFAYNIFLSPDGSSSFGSLQELRSGASFGSGNFYEEFSVVAGETYYIRFAGYGYNDGNYTMIQSSGPAGVLPQIVDGGTGTLGAIGDGAHEMIGGDGDDRYYVDSADDVVTENGGEGYDTVYTTVDYTLPDNVERIIAFANTGLTLTGNALDNSLIGGAGGDTLYGLDGDDTLNGRGGVDTMVGGLGDDSYVVNKPSDVVVELAGEGVDTVYTTSAYRLSDNVENIVIRGDAGLSVKGNALANAMTGGVGADTLIGYDGDDRLDGRGGADSMIGGAGDDSYFVNDAGDVVVELADEGTDTVYTTVDHILAANVENVIVRSADGLAVTGNDSDNAMTGGAGADRLAGGLGADSIKGGAGHDLLIGSAGKDVLTGGAGNDTFLFHDVGDAGDTITDFQIDSDFIAIDVEGFGLTSFDASLFESNVGGVATTAEARFVYNETNGRLLFDADGSGSGRAVLLATLRGAPELTADHFLDADLFG